MANPLPNAFTGLREDFPEIASAYDALAAATQQAGPLTERERQLVKLALAVGAGLEGATRFSRPPESGAGYRPRRAASGRAAGDHHARTSDRRSRLDLDSRRDRRKIEAAVGARRAVPLFAHRRSPIPSHTYQIGLTTNPVSSAGTTTTGWVASRMISRAKKITISSTPSIKPR